MQIKTSHRIKARLAILLAGIVSLSVLVVSPALAVASPYSSTGVTASVNGRTVSAQVKIKATTKVTAALAGICARNSGGGIVDFPYAAGIDLLPTGTTIFKQRTLSPGVYTFWACALVSGKWSNISAKLTFTISNTLSGEPMPVGDLTGWHQIFKDDFSTNVAAGAFPGPYATRWGTYVDGTPDSSGNGVFESKTLSVHDGMMDMYLHSENGQALGAAPVPLVDGVWKGQLYGRYSLRFKSDSLAKWGAGWILWPDSNNWNEGEIDFPEGSLDNTIGGFTHCLGHAADNCSYLFSSTRFASGWHTATIEWRPTSVAFYLDGINLITTANGVPQTLMHWVLMTATNGGKPAATTAGHVMVDWATIYALA